MFHDASNEPTSPKTAESKKPGKPSSGFSSAGGFGFCEFLVGRGAIVFCQIFLHCRPDLVSSF